MASNTFLGNGQWAGNSHISASAIMVPVEIQSSLSQTFTALQTTVMVPSEGKSKELVPMTVEEVPFEEGTEVVGEWQCVKGFKRLGINVISDSEEYEIKIETSFDGVEVMGVKEICTDCKLGCSECVEITAPYVRLVVKNHVEGTDVKAKFYATM